MSLSVYVPSHWYTVLPHKQKHAVIGETYQTAVRHREMTACRRMRGRLPAYGSRFFAASIHAWRLIVATQTSDLPEPLARRRRRVQD